MDSAKSVQRLLVESAIVLQFTCTLWNIAQLEPRCRVCGVAPDTRLAVGVAAVVIKEVTKTVAVRSL